MGFIFFHIIRRFLRAFQSVRSELWLNVYDLPLIIWSEMDARRPVEAIARKMIRNAYNGDFSRKTDMISDLIEELHP